MRIGLLALFLAAPLAAAVQVAGPAPQGPGTGGRGGGAGAPVQTPPRDLATAQAPAGSGRLSGRVVTGPSNLPVFRAVVQLGTGNLQTARWTLTDAEGRWMFEDVPGGSYTLTASRDGFVSMGYGQRGAYGTPAPVVLADKTTLGSLDISLPRGGVVTGLVMDERGEGLGGAVVRAHRVRFVDGVRQLVDVRGGMQFLLSGGMTDDRGEYRLYGLAPGTYYLSATYGQMGQGRTDDRDGYAVTYAPGSVLVAEASPFVISADKVSTANFALARTRVATVSGRVVNSSGAPTAGQIRLAPVAPGHAVEATTGAMTARSDASGAFSVRGVPIGTYVLTANSASGPLAVSVTDAGISARGSGPGANGMGEVGLTTITVSGQDVQDVFIQTGPSALVNGLVRVDSDAREASADGFYISTKEMAPGATSLRGFMATARSNANGSFAIPGLLGKQIIRLQNPKTGWWLKSVTTDGVDITDSGFDFQGGRTVNVELVVTQRMASLSGTVRDASGKPATDYSVVAFAQDDGKWTPYTRFIATSAANVDGTFRIEGLPAGDYVVVAVPPIEAGDETDPERLKTWRGVGRPVTLAEAQAATVALALSR